MRTSGDDLPFVPRLYLGLAMWANADWRGALYAPRTVMTESLPDYAQQFNTVEGNTTFYSGAPKDDTLQAWSRQTPESFRFCFKLPSRLTHDLRLQGCDDAVDHFLNQLRQLGPRVGPVMVQLPRDFGPQELPRLEALLARWPDDIPCAVEPRDRAFFAKGESEQLLNRLLISLGIDRVMLDVRPLFATEADVGTSLFDAQQEKPKRPLHVLSTSSSPIVRFIGHHDIALNERYFEAWSQRLALWISQGKTPFLFVHTPDNRRAPELARRFCQRIAEVLGSESGLPMPGRFIGEQQEQLF